MQTTIILFPREPLLPSQVRNLRHFPTVSRAGEDFVHIETHGIGALAHAPTCALAELRVAYRAYRPLSRNMDLPQFAIVGQKIRDV